MFEGVFGFHAKWLAGYMIVSFSKLIAFTSYIENDDLEEPFRFSNHNHNYNYNYQCKKKIKTVRPPPFMRPDEKARRKLVEESYDTLLILHERLNINIDSSDDETENNDNVISVTYLDQNHNHNSSCEGKNWKKFARDNPMKCTICTDVMICPHIIDSCGHSFCGNCLDTYLKKKDECDYGCKKKCPVCLMTIKSLTHQRNYDHTISRDINRMQPYFNNPDDQKVLRSRKKEEEDFLNKKNLNQLHSLFSTNSSNNDHDNNNGRSSSNSRRDDWFDGLVDLVILTVPALTIGIVYFKGIAYFKGIFSSLFSF